MPQNLIIADPWAGSTTATPLTLDLNMDKMIPTIDSARLLPALSDPSFTHATRALALVPRMFAQQPWFDREKTASIIRDLLQFYNQQEGRKPYLAFL